MMAKVMIGARPRQFHRTTLISSAHAMDDGDGYDLLGKKTSHTKSGKIRKIGILI